MTASEELNRLRRATLLADLLQATGITAMEAANAGEVDWAQAADGLRAIGEAFNNTPSPETQKLTISLLQRREDFARRLKR